MNPVRLYVNICTIRYSLVNTLLLFINCAPLIRSLSFSAPTSRSPIRSLISALAISMALPETRLQILNGPPELTSCLMREVKYSISIEEVDECLTFYRILSPPFNDRQGFVNRNGIDSSFKDYWRLLRMCTLDKADRDFRTSERKYTHHMRK